MLSNLFLNGALAGLIAVIAMTIVMIIGKKTGMMPAKLDIGLMLGRKLLGKDADEGKARKIGMMMHIVNGVIFGIIFSFLKGASLLLFSGVILQALFWSVILWVAMMLIVMPMMGKGVFGLDIAKRVPMMTLMVHLIFGLVLGLVF